MSKPTKKERAWQELLNAVFTKRLPGTRGKYEIQKQKRLKIQKLRKQL